LSLPLICFRAGKKLLAIRNITITVSTDQVLTDHPAGLHLFHLIQQIDGNLVFLLYIAGVSLEDADIMCK
jgi:hypothetical protein